MKPCSSMWRTMKPISSMCAAHTTFLEEDLPRIRHVMLPMLSTSITSESGRISRTIRSRTSFSKPGAPATSHSCLKSVVFISSQHTLDYRKRQGEYGRKCVVRNVYSLKRTDEMKKITQKLIFFLNNYSLCGTSKETESQPRFLHCAQCNTKKTTRPWRQRKQPNRLQSRLLLKRPQRRRRLLPRR